MGYPTLGATSCEAQGQGLRCGRRAGGGGEGGSAALAGAARARWHLLISDPLLFSSCRSGSHLSWGGPRSSQGPTSQPEPGEEETPDRFPKFCSVVRYTQSQVKHRPHGGQEKQLPASAGRPWTSLVVF